MPRDYDDRLRRPRSWDAEDDYDDPVSDGRWRDLPHSGLGIISFVVGLVAIALFIILMVFAVVQRPRTLGPDYARQQALDTLLGLLTCGTILVALVGVGLGIGGMCQSNRRMVFGVVGLCLNGVFLLGMLVLFLIGTAVTPRYR